MLPPISTMAPMQHEVDWFIGNDGWKIFDSRRCNLLENMMHHWYCLNIIMLVMSPR